MNNIGIVAEYNPFHYGHKYQLEYARKQLNANQITVVMSGDYVQRGGPAICDKYIRARTAVNCGADIVIELPLHVAVADSLVFTQGAVDILKEYGCDYLLFGSECGEIDTLRKIAELMLTQDYGEQYSTRIKEGLCSDLARIKTLSVMLGTTADSISYINSPNNLLGIYYICAIMRRGYDILPFTCKRIGQDYFDSQFSKDKQFASATAIRKYLQSDEVVKEELIKYVPEEICNELLILHKNGKLHYIEDYEHLIIKRILECDANTWNNICENIPYLEIKKAAESSSMSEIRRVFLTYVSELKMERIFFWLVLKHHRVSIDEFMNKPTDYGRVLCKKNNTTKQFI